MNIEVQIRRVDAGARTDNLLSAATTEAQVNQLIAGRDVIRDVAPGTTEVQLRGLAQYVRAIATGLDTSSIETAISAVI